MSTMTNGRARPSLRPDSTLSICRRRIGTRMFPTSAAANTGSVGARIAPRSRHSTAVRSVSHHARSAVSSIVSGIPNSSARPGSRQAVRRSTQPTRMPSVKRTAKRAASARAKTSGSLGVMTRTSRLPSPSTMPTTRKSTAVESTVRCARAERRTATSSVPA